MWAPDYGDVDALKAYLRIEDEIDDTEIQSALSAASRAVDEHCGRQFGKTEEPELRQYTAEHGRGYALLVVDDLMTLAGLAIETDGQAITPERWWPLNAPQNGMPWTRVHLPVSTTCEVGAIEVTATWGWTAVPSAVEHATMLQAARLFKRRDAPFGVAGSPELGSELRLLAKVDPDVAVTLAKYVRRARVA